MAAIGTNKQSAGTRKRGGASNGVRKGGRGARGGGGASAIATEDRRTKRRADGTSAVKRGAKKRSAPRTAKGAADNGGDAVVEQGRGGLDDSPRGRILRAASHLFVTRGFAATTVRDLAAEVGILSGSLFHHFRNKGEILEAVMVEVIELNTGRMRQALSGAKAPMDRVRALMRCELTSINGDTSEAMNLLIQEWHSLDRASQKRVLVLRERYEKLWVDALVAAGKDLVAVEPLVLRRLIAGMNAHTTYWFRPGDPLTIDDLTESVMKTLVRKAGGR